jgi:hypothetical protein
MARPRKMWKWWVRFNPEANVEYPHKQQAPRVEYGLFTVEVTGDRRRKTMAVRDPETGEPDSVPSAREGALEYGGRFANERIAGAAESFWEAKCRIRDAKRLIIEYVRKFFRRQLAEASRYGLRSCLTAKEEEGRWEYWNGKGWS